MAGKETTQATLSGPPSKDRYKEFAEAYKKKKGFYPKGVAFLAYMERNQDEWPAHQQDHETWGETCRRVGSYGSRKEKAKRTQ